MAHAKAGCDSKRPVIAPGRLKIPIFMKAHLAATPYDTRAVYGLTTAFMPMTPRVRRATNLPPSLKMNGLRLFVFERR